MVLAEQWRQSGGGRVMVAQRWRQHVGGVGWVGLRRAGCDEVGYNEPVGGAWEWVVNVMKDDSDWRKGLQIIKRTSSARSIL